MTETQGSKSSPKAALWCVVIAVVIVIIGSQMKGSDSSPSDAHYTASAACHNAVKKRLKSPSTADFSEVADETITGDKDTGYTVSGHVDSENSFGASLRSTFSCDVTVDGDTDYAIVTSFEDGGSLDT